MGKNINSTLGTHRAKCYAIVLCAYEILQLSLRNINNVVAHALSRRHTLLSQLDAKNFVLESIKDLYATDLYFSEPYSKCCGGKG